MKKSDVATVVAVILVGLVGIDFLNIEPVVIGAFIDYSGLTVSQGGQVAAAHMAGAMVGTIIVPFIIALWNLRKLVIIALCLVVITELGSTLTNSVLYLGGLRSFAGFGDGLLYAIACGIIAGMRQAERVFGLLLVVQFLLGAFGFYVLPSVLPSTGVQGIFYIFAIMAVIAVLMTRWFPERAADQVTKRGMLDVLDFRAILSLSALLLYTISSAIIWSYSERIGVAGGISIDAVGTSLAISMILSIPAAMISVLIGVRYGRLIPFVTGTLLSVTGAILLMGSFSLYQFAIAVCFANIALSIMNPYFMGQLGALDPKGRVATMGAAVLFLGLALGPAVASVLIKDGNFIRALFLSAGGFMVSFVMIIYVVLPGEGWRGKKLVDMSTSE